MGQFRFFQEENLNRLVYRLCKDSKDWIALESRGGVCYETMNPTIVLEDARQRHLNLKGRNSNIFATICETFWVLAGQKDLDPIMKFILPRSEDFSNDNGRTWSDAYGPRLDIYQWQTVLNHFKREGKNARRATMSITDPSLDTTEGLLDRGLPENSAVPCNNFMWFWIRDNKFHCKLGNRSNDLIWGFSGINAFEFTLIQEILFGLVSKYIHNDIVLGEYVHCPVSLHYYEFTKSQVEAVRDNPMFYESFDTLPVLVSQADDYNTALVNMFELFDDIYHLMVRIVESETFKDVKRYMESLNDAFESHNVTTEGNILYEYAELALSYLATKKFKENSVILLKETLGGSLLNAVENNKFKPENLILE